jgi:hypothetical protein
MGCTRGNVKKRTISGANLTGSREVRHLFNLTPKYILLMHLDGAAKPHKTHPAFVLTSHRCMRVNTLDAADMPPYDARLLCGSPGETKQL